MDKLVNFRMSMELWERVQAEAKAKGMSGASLIRMLLIEYFNSKE